MKPIEWVGLGLAGIILIVIIAKMTSTPVQTNGASNSLVGGLGSFFAGLTKITAPSGNPGFTSPGSSASNYEGTGLSAAQYGQQYSAAMASTAESASLSAGSGGTTVGGGLSVSEGGGLGGSTNSFQLTPPSFDIGVDGADFSTI